MMISKENRAEFEQIGAEQLRKRVDVSIYADEKLRQAREWLKENDPAWISAHAAQRAGTRATIALLISAAALIVSMIGLWNNHFSRAIPARVGGASPGAVFQLEPNPPVAIRWQF